YERHRSAADKDDRIEATLIDLLDGVFKRLFRDRRFDVVNVKQDRSRNGSTASRRTHRHPFSLEVIKSLNAFFIGENMDLFRIKIEDDFDFVEEVHIQVLLGHIGNEP